MADDDKTEAEAQLPARRTQANEALPVLPTKPRCSARCRPLAR
jgi:hypothetical protein